MRITSFGISNPITNSYDIYVCKTSKRHPRVKKVIGILNINKNRSVVDHKKVNVRA